MSEQTEKKPNSGRKVFFAILAAIYDTESGFVRFDI